MRECPACGERTVSLLSLVKEVFASTGLQCENCRAVVKLNEEQGLGNLIIQVCGQMIVFAGALYALYVSIWVLCLIAVSLGFGFYVLGRSFGKLSVGGLRGSLTNFNSGGSA